MQAQVERFEHHRLAAECDKLDVIREQALAEEGLTQDFREQK